MKNKWKINLKNIVSSIYGATYNKWFPPAGVRILTYHSVGDNIPEDYLDYYNISPELFKKHMEFIAKNCHVIPLSEIKRHSHGVVVTFDDGYTNNLTVAAPIMEDLNIPFTVFPTVEFIQSNNDLYLSVDQVVKLSTLNGVTIGSHCLTHSRLTQYDDQQLEQELISSKLFLENLLEKSVDCIAYPYGDVDQCVVEASANAGYVLGASVKFGVNPHDFNPLILLRTDILSHDNMKIFKDKINGNWDWMSLIK